MKIKQKILDVVWVVGIGFAVLFCLLQIELQAWKELVNLEYQWLYANNQPIEINYKHQESINNFIRWNFGVQAKTAKAIFMAESGLRCDSVSRTGDYGIAQINAKAHPQYSVAELLDCQTNIKIAAEIYKRQGNFTAWVAYNTGAYRKFIE